MTCPGGSGGLNPNPTWRQVSAAQEGLSFPGGIQAETCDLQTYVLSRNLWRGCRAGRRWAPWWPRQLLVKPSPSLLPPLQS